MSLRERHASQLRHRSTRFANTLPTPYARRVVNRRVDRRCKLLRLCLQTKGAGHDSNDPRAAVYRIADLVVIAGVVEGDLAADVQYWPGSGAARAPHCGRVGVGVRRGAGAREAAIRAATGRARAELL